MSKHWKLPVYGVKGRIGNWINNIYITHDMICGCDNPILHLINEVTIRGGISGLTSKQIETIKQCLGESDHTAASGTEDIKQETGDPADNIDFGDLNKLFEEDDGFGGDDSG